MDVKCLWVRNEKSRGVLVQCFSRSWEGKSLATSMVDFDQSVKGIVLKVALHHKETWTSRTLQTDKKNEKEESI